MASAYLLLTRTRIKNYNAHSHMLMPGKANLEYLSGYGDGLRLMCLKMGKSASLIAYLRVASKTLIHPAVAVKSISQIYG